MEDRWKSWKISLLKVMSAFTAADLRYFSMMNDMSNLLLSSTTQENIHTIMRVAKKGRKCLIELLTTCMQRWLLIQLQYLRGVSAWWMTCPSLFEVPRHKYTLISLGVCDEGPEMLYRADKKDKNIILKERKTLTVH